MSPGDVLAALLACVVWGLTFIAIKFGVGEAPPLLLSALRFAFAAFPLVLFVKPPRAPPGLVVMYGLLIGVGQFGLLFQAMAWGMPVGLASVVIQLQAFITILLAWVLLGERPTRIQGVATTICLAGVFVIGAARLGPAGFVPFAMTVAAASCWAAGNLVGKRVGKVDPIAFVAWSSLVAPLPLLGLSFALEHGRTWPALAHPTLTLAISVAVIAYGGSVIGYGVWSRLLNRYPAARVAPFALLVPVIGMFAGRLVFDEPVSAIEYAGACLVMAGLGFNILGDRWKAGARETRVTHA